MRCRNVSASLFSIKRGAIVVCERECPYIRIYIRGDDG